MRAARINNTDKFCAAYCCCISRSRLVFPLPASAAIKKIFALAPIHSRNLISISSRCTYTPGMYFFSATRVSNVSLFSSAIRFKNSSLVNASGLNGVSFCLSRSKRFSFSKILPDVCFSVPSGLKNLIVLPV